MPFSPSAVRRLRTERALSLEQLAIAVERSYPSVRGYEAGLIVPPTEVAEKIADALGVPIGDLFEADR